MARKDTSSKLKKPKNQKESPPRTNEFYLVFGDEGSASATRSKLFGKKAKALKEGTPEKSKSKRLPYEPSLETGSRVYQDVTEAIRWKHRLSHVRGPLLVKCPVCHANYSKEHFEEHRARCRKRLR